MEHALSPVASRVIAKCGGVAEVARLTGRKKVSIHKWRHPKSKGGTGGLVPADMQKKLMEAALRGEVDLTTEDFFDLPEDAEREERGEAA